VAGIRQARTACGDLKLCAPLRGVRTILEMTGLIARIDVLGDAAGGLGSRR
jgi:hypothetical protein